MVDTIAPPAPTVTSVDGQTGTITTNDPTPTFVGTGEPGSTITITDGSGNVIGTGVVDASGNWTITPTTPLPEGTSVVTVTATDPAGNTSPPTTVTVVVDTIAPPSLSITIYDPNNCNGHIWGGIFDPTGTHIVRVRVYSGTTLVHQRVPPLTTTGAFYIYPNYTDPMSTGGYTGYIAPGVYTVIYGGETTTGIEVVSGSYISFLGRGCPTSNGGGYVPVSLPTPTDLGVLVGNMTDQIISTLQTTGKRMIRRLTAPHRSYIDNIFTATNEIIHAVATLPTTGVEVVDAETLMLDVAFDVLYGDESDPAQPFILPKTGADTDYQDL